MAVRPKNVHPETLGVCGGSQQLLLTWSDQNLPAKKPLKNRGPSIKPE